MPLTKDQIAALSNDPAILKKQILKLHDVIDSFEDAKRQRQEAAKAVETGPAAAFEIDVFNAKAALEGLADGSEDHADPRTRLRICNGAIGLIGRLFAALPKV